MAGNGVFVIGFAFFSAYYRVRRPVGLKNNVCDYGKANRLNLSQFN